MTHGVKLRKSCNTFFTVKRCSQLIISINRGVPSDFSSDLDMGGPPKLKSDEKSEGTPLVIEIQHV